MLAKQRDSAAWSTIYSQHYDSVFRYLFGRLGRKEESEDLASQVFLEALRSIDSFNDRGKPLAAWLFGIARNVANSQFRSARKRGRTEPLLNGDFEDEKAFIGDLQAESMDLIEGINGLTKEQRETVVLRFYVGLSAKEAGEILGKTEHAIYALQVRAIAALRRLLGEKPGEQEESAA
ncbi:MAG TPA: sigma-70 family RNA polymerase sigma factor [Dehalococcoidia bacterium]|nr:sigma-70 family RNA polymerase sigma factor [Dehalococcoidia bacterium]